MKTLTKKPDRAIVIAEKIAEAKELMLQRDNMYMAYSKKLRDIFAMIEHDFLKFYKEHEHCSVTKAKEMFANSTLE